MLLDLFSKKVLINGKKVSMNKVTNIIEESVNNIIITGFKSIPELEKIVAVNGRNCDYLIDNILYKLQIAYTNSIEKESEKALTDKTAAYNISLMIANQMIVLKLLNNRINNFINTVPEEEEVKKIEQEDEIEYLDYEDRGHTLSRPIETEKSILKSLEGKPLAKQGKTNVFQYNVDNKYRYCQPPNLLLYVLYLMKFH